MYVVILLISVMAMLAPQPTPPQPFYEFIQMHLERHLIKPCCDDHWDLIEALGDDTQLHLCIKATRSLGKTLYAGRFFPLYLICTSHYPEIQTFSRTGGAAGLSAKSMNWITREIESNLPLRAFYGLEPGDSWGQEHIEIRRADGHVIDLYCRGKRASARGNRGIVIIDDPQNTDDCKSETVLERDKDWLLEDILPILLEDQRLIFIGTPISPISLLSTVEKLPGVKTLCFTAEKPKHSGKSAWPEQWSNEFLELRKQQMGLDRYASEYLCEPRVPGTPVFKAEWFQYYEPDSVQFERISKDFVFTVTGFDGAESKATQADYTAIVTVSATEGAKPDYYVRDVRRERWSVKEGAEQLLLTYDTYKQNQTVVESRCAPPNKDAIIEELEERQRIYHKYVNVRQVKPHRDKVTRASEIQSLIQDGRVYFDPRDKNQSHLMDELTMFTGSQDFHDDCVDALVYALKELKDREATHKVKIESTLAENW